MGKKRIETYASRCVTRIKASLLLQLLVLRLLLLLSTESEKLFRERESNGGKGLGFVGGKKQDGAQDTTSASSRGRHAHGPDLGRTHILYFGARSDNGPRLDRTIGPSACLIYL